MTQKNLAEELEQLATQMYATSDPLTVRIQTHECYTQPAVDFFSWVLDHIPWRGDEVVVDIGCGAGAYIEPIYQRLIDGGELLTIDLSRGMLLDTIAKAARKMTPINADAMHLPLADASCDIALANHMLYHVPLIEQALAEAHRVLRPGGLLVAATNARDSMTEFLNEIGIACRALGSSITVPTSPVQTRFTLENGKDIIRSFFPSVARYALESALVFPEAAPAVAFVNSLREAYETSLPEPIAWEALMAQLYSQVEAKVATQGEYRVPKTTGVFIATRQE